MSPDKGFRLVVQEIKVVDEKQVDSTQAETLQAVFKGAHDGIVAIVEDNLEGKASNPGRALENGRIGGRSEDAAYFGRNDEFIPFLLRKKAAHPVLAPAQPVPGRGVEVADTVIPGSLLGSLGIFVADAHEQFPDGSSSKSELSEFHPRASKRPFFSRVHGEPPEIRNADAVLGGKNGNLDVGATLVVAVENGPATRPAHTKTVVGNVASP